MKLLSLAGSASLAAAAALDAQIPLAQGPVVAPAADDVKLVESQALQDTIKAANLKTRAEKLYEIAQLSEDEYNHPTRVIGSAGTWLTSPPSHLLSAPS